MILAVTTLVQGCENFGSFRADQPESYVHIENALPDGSQILIAHIGSMRAGIDGNRSSTFNEWLLGPGDSISPGVIAITDDSLFFLNWDSSRKIYRATNTTAICNMEQVFVGRYDFLFVEVTNQPDSYQPSSPSGFALKDVAAEMAELLNTKIDLCTDR